MLSANKKLIIFDTTMRDGELTPNVQMNLQNKISIAKVLEEMGVGIIEVGYPGHNKKDFEEIHNISKLIKNSTICGLASSNLNEINMVAEAIKPAKRGRTNAYNSAINSKPKLLEKQVLKTIKDSISLVRNFCIVWVLEKEMQI